MKCDNFQIDVAVKTLHDDNKVNKKNFLKEAEVMMNLNHLYIVKLVGVCHGPPVAMVRLPHSWLSFDT